MFFRPPEPEGLTWPKLLKRLLVGQPIWPVESYGDGWLRLFGIPGLALLAHVYNLHLNPYLVDQQLQPFAWFHTLWFVYITWQINLQVNYWLDYYHGHASFRERAKQQLWVSLLWTHGITLLSAIIHFVFYGLTWASFVLGIKYYTTILGITVVMNMVYLMVYVPVAPPPTARRRRDRADHAPDENLEYDIAEDPENVSSTPKAESQESEAQPKAQLVPPSPPTPVPVVERQIVLELVKRNVVLSPDDVEYGMIQNRVVMVQTQSRGELVTKYSTLAELEAQLPMDSFFRINRQYIVRMDRIRSYQKVENGALEVQADIGGTLHSFHVSRYKAPMFQQRLNQQLQGA
jgi:hypothetical protein